MDAPSVQCIREQRAVVRISWSDINNRLLAQYGDDAL